MRIIGVHLRASALSVLSTQASVLLFKEEIMTHDRCGHTRRQFLTQAAGATAGVLGLAKMVSAGASVAPQPGVGGAPASVDRLTVAVDSWGWDTFNTLQSAGPNFLQDYISLLLLL